MTGGHGTYAGYQAHRKRREQACQPCRDAAASYAAMWRFVRGELPLPRRCPRCGSFFPDVHACSLTPVETVRSGR